MNQSEQLEKQETSAPSLQTQTTDSSADRFLGIALLVLGCVFLFCPTTMTWWLERLLALGILGGGAYFMITSKKTILNIVGILGFLIGGNLLVKAGEGIGLLALTVGLGFVFQGYKLFQDSQLNNSTRWININGAVTTFLGIVALWQWGDFTGTAISMVIGLKLIMLGIYHNIKANQIANTH
ncbi:MAG: hypothetical protein R3Y10_13225 [Ferrimonas sp.]